MKVVTCAFAAAGSAVLVVSCAPTSPDTSSPEEGSIARLVSDEHEDLGLVSYEEHATRIISIQNVSESPISLSVLRRSCGCVDVELSPTVVAPGACASATFGTVVADDARAQRHMILLRATTLEERPRMEDIRASFSFTPDIEFAVHPTTIRLELIEGEAFRRSIYVQPRGFGELAVEEVRVVPASLAATVPTLMSGSNTYVFSVAGTFDRVGLEAGYVELVTNSERFRRVRIPISARVGPEVAPVPPAVVVTGAGAAPIERTVVIHGTTEDLVIGSEPPDGVTCSIRFEDGRNVLDITLDPAAAMRGNGGGTIDLCSSSGALVCRLPLLWWLAESG